MKKFRVVLMSPVPSQLGLGMSVPVDEPGRLSPKEIAGRLAGAGAASTATRLLAAATLIGGAALFNGAAASDVDQHPREPAWKGLRVTGSTLPYAESALAGAAWRARRRA